MNDGGCSGEVIWRGGVILFGADVGWDVICKHANVKGSGGNVIVFYAFPISGFAVCWMFWHFGAGLMMFYKSASQVTLR